jgi:hypothetical protein
MVLALERSSAEATAAVAVVLFDGAASVLSSIAAVLRFAAGFLV